MTPTEKGLKTKGLRHNKNSEKNYLTVPSGSFPVTLLHIACPKLHRVLAILSAIGLKECSAAYSGSTLFAKKLSNIIVISDLESADFVCSQTVKKVCISLQTQEILSTQILSSDDQQINILYKICTLHLLQLEISL